MSPNRWLTQTKVGGGHVPPEDRGDCVPACIASILGLPITAIVNCHGADWWDRLNAECGRHGYCIAQWWALVPLDPAAPIRPDGREEN